MRQRYEVRHLNMPSCRTVLLIAATLAAGACAPALHPLTGAPTKATLPRAQLASGYRQIVFDWELEDRELSGRGEGVARVAAPDSARLDLFLAGGFGSGAD